MSLAGIARFESWPPRERAAARLAPASKRERMSYEGYSAGSVEVQSYYG